MSGVWVFVFWGSLLFAAYTYVGYPLLLWLWSRWRERPLRRDARDLPSVTAIVAARNERAAIAAKIESLLAQDYPRELVQIVVALDAPTDGTDAAARAFAKDGVEVLTLDAHQGKAAALRAALARARGEIVIFADARQQIDGQAFRALTGPFADPTVGVVTSELRLTDGEGGTADDAVGLYWRYETAIRTWESRIHSVAGATGALYAARRLLITPPPAETILDDVFIPMSAVLRGSRCVLEPEAKVWDRVSCCAAAEYRRKVRTLAGNFQLLTLLPALVDPRVNPIWLQFVSHKVARLFVPYALVLLLASTARLALLGAPYSIFLVIQLAFYALAAAGPVLGRTRERAAVAPARRSEVS